MSCFVLLLCFAVDQAYVPPQKRRKRSASVKKPKVSDLNRRSRSRKCKEKAIVKLHDFAVQDAKVADNGELNSSEEGSKRKSRHKHNSHHKAKDVHVEVTKVIDVHIEVKKVVDVHIEVMKKVVNQLVLPNH